MNTEEYFESLNQGFEKAYKVASAAKAKGFDPENFVEVKVAPDIASRVEGIIGVHGLADIIKSKFREQPRTELAFEIVKEICTDKRFDNYEPLKRVELAVRVGLAIQTDGVLVAPTEGMVGIARYKNADNSDYIALLYAGPIRSAGGTSVALSVAFADYARKFISFGTYKPTQDEVERYVEEMELYDARAARLQYKPSEDDLRKIVENCPICVDGLPTEDVEVGVHRDLKRIGSDGKEIRMTNRLRGGVSLVLCEGIAQKAKKVLKQVKIVGLDWSWLNQVIKVEKSDKPKKEDEQKDSHSFLDELVAGRPILSYPNLMGGFRLRYGRSRMTGIAAMGVSPATMILTMGFMAVGTQLKMEQPRKGCVVTPVDLIEGPFVKLRSGETMRINDCETAEKLKDDIEEILSLGDILITYGDFKNANTPLMPTSYVEEFWEAQLHEKEPGAKIDHNKINFKEAFELSVKHSIPIHPKFLFEFQGVSPQDIALICSTILTKSKIYGSTNNVLEVDKVEIDNVPEVKRALELLNVTHELKDGKILIKRDFAQSLLASIGFAADSSGKFDAQKAKEAAEKFGSFGKADTIEAVNGVAPFKVMRRATFIAARIGRPEKAKERLMKPAPNVLYPIGDYGGKERNLSRAYAMDTKRFGAKKFSTEIARYVCPSCKRLIDTPFCYDCERSGKIIRKCEKCGYIGEDIVCRNCGIDTRASENREVDISKLVTNAMKRVGVSRMPDTVKGVKGLMSKEKKVEPLEKGILRSLYSLYIFKDGTIRFDGTDVPLTHFYPKEMGVSFKRLRELGYTVDYFGKELNSDDQLVELKHQDVILSKRGADYLFRATRFIDELLEKFYGLEKFYNLEDVNGLLGQNVITLSPHTSCGVLGRIIGFTEANVGFAHPYTISARRRNCDGDEDTTMLLLDGLINFSKAYLPTTIGATMDAPLILTPNVMPEEVDDEVHATEVCESFPLEFYNKTLDSTSTAEINIESVKDRLQKKDERFKNLRFTHWTSAEAIRFSPKKSKYTTLNNMQSKVEVEFALMNMIHAVDARDAAKKLILSHFIPDLIGNLHRFSRQGFRCSVCNAKYRRIPLLGKCTKCGGKLLLTVSKGGIEKYLEIAIGLSDKYNIETYIKQRLRLVKEEIDNLFSEEILVDEKQFNLSKFM